MRNRDKLHKVSDKVVKSFPQQRSVLSQSPKSCCCLKKVALLSQVNFWATAASGLRLESEFGAKIQERGGNNTSTRKSFLSGQFGEEREDLDNRRTVVRGGRCHLAARGFVVSRQGKEQEGDGPIDQRVVGR